MEICEYCGRPKPAFPRETCIGCGAPAPRKYPMYPQGWKITQYGVIPRFIASFGPYMTATFDY